MCVGGGGEGCLAFCDPVVALGIFFFRGVIGSIGNINYIKSKIKENLNISISLKKKSIQIHEILQLSFMRFHFLKSLHNNFFY